MESGRRLREYLGSLPNGLASYPECRTKTTIALSSLEKHDPRELAKGVSEELATLILNPPPLGVWMPAAHADAIFHLVCDKHYPSEALMMDWRFRSTMAIGETSLYTVMLRVSRPRIFFSMSTRAHGLFQRGTDFELLVNKADRMVARLTFPPHLHNRFNLLANVPLLRAAAELTGGKNATCSMIECSATSADYECTWT